MERGDCGTDVRRQSNGKNTRIKYEISEMVNKSIIRIPLTFLSDFHHYIKFVISIYHNRTATKDGKQKFPIIDFSHCPFVLDIRFCKLS